MKTHKNHPIAWEGDGVYILDPDSGAWLRPRNIKTIENYMAHGVTPEYISGSAQYFKQFPLIAIPARFDLRKWSDVSYGNDEGARLEQNAKTRSGGTVTLWVFSDDRGPEELYKYTVEFMPADGNEREAEWQSTDDLNEAERLIRKFNKA